MVQKTGTGTSPNLVFSPAEAIWLGGSSRFLNHAGSRDPAGRVADNAGPPRHPAGEDYNGIEGSGLSVSSLREVIVARRPVGREATSVRTLDPALERALVAARTAEDNRGRDIVILDLRELTTMFDYFIIATGTSRRQLHAMSEEIDHALEEGMGDRRIGIEGYEESRWILLDYGDLVIHLFDDETRRYYAIEELWGQAKRVHYESQYPKAAAGLQTNQPSDAPDPPADE
ncbi:MAG: ribosome silencing factor [Rhodopirellula sp.]|nr:ribosome silencing factor [Rhodopirellula sp.]